MERNREIILKEKFDSGLKHALFANFKNSIEAILEITDNSVSHRLKSNPLTINILISNKNITIIDKGGEGMNLETLQEFLEWGKIKPRSYQDIGAYSQGGKAAMGYLGNRMSLITSPAGKKIQYRIDDDDIHKYKLKQYRVLKIPTDAYEGQTQIDIANLRRKINGEQLKQALLNTYRPLIENKKVIIKYNGEILTINSFPLDNTFEIEKFFIKDEHSKKIAEGWIGRLGAKTGIKGGVRCYNKGRLICDKEFFSKYDAHYKGTLNFLFGEVNLDQVPTNTNKTDFDRDSGEWEYIQNNMYTILKPHIDELLGREIKEPTDEEKSRIKNAKEIVAELMRKRKKDLRGCAIEGEAKGQKKSEKRGEKKRKEPLNNRGKYQPRTPPPKNAIGKRRRLREFMDWEIRPMEELLRSIIEEKDNSKSKVLVINNLFPGYKEAKGNLLYLIETAAIQLSMPEKDEKITPEEYIQSFDDLYGYFCDNFSEVKEIVKNKNTRGKKIKRLNTLTLFKCLGIH